MSHGKNKPNRHPLTTPFRLAPALPTPNVQLVDGRRPEARRGSRRGTMSQPVSVFAEARRVQPSSRDRTQVAKLGSAAVESKLSDDDIERYDKALKNAAKHVLFGDRIKRKTAVFYSIDTERFTADMFVRMEQYVTKKHEDKKVVYHGMLELPDVVQRHNEFHTAMDTVVMGAEIPAAALPDPTDGRIGEQ